MQSYGRYELLERLGRGGMAEVFLARMNGPMHVSRYVALKRILPDISNIPELNVMFLDEIRLAVHLSHPSIGAVYDFGTEDGCIFLTLELIDGQDLRALLQRALHGQPIPLECALYIAAQVARALDYAHKASDAQERPLGIVHRDVTPSNVLVSYRGDVKLVDFGIARAASHVRLNHTRHGEIKGTIRYMSPEQAAGNDIDWRSDLFSLTTVLLELVIGHPAFKSEADVQALKLVQAGRAPERDKYAALIPDDVGAIIDRGMQVDREARFQSGEALAGELERALRSRSPAFGPHDVARMMEQLFAAELAQHRRRMRAHAEGFSDETPDPARRVLAMAETCVPETGEPRTRAGKSHPLPSSSEVTAPVGQMTTPPPLTQRRRGSLWLVGAAGLTSLALLVAWQTRAHHAAVEPAPMMDTHGPALPIQPPATHAIVTPPPSGTVTAQAPTAAQLPLAAPPSASAARPAHGSFGTLNLQSSPWAAVTVDGKSVGQTPLVGLRLPAGKHRVTLANPGLPVRTLKIVVPPNASIDKSITLTD